MREPFTLLPHAGGRRATSSASSMLDSPAQVARFAPLADAGASPVKQHTPTADSVKANTRYSSTNKENYPITEHTTAGTSPNSHPAIEHREWMRFSGESRVFARA